MTFPEEIQPLSRGLPAISVTTNAGGSAYAKMAEAVILA
jgi:hypothetical protein